MKNRKKTTPHLCSSDKPTGQDNIPVTDRRRFYFTAALVSLLTLIVYLPALRNGFVAGWDDALYVLDNVYIRSLRWEFFRWAAIDASVPYWQPLTWISHAVDYALWGLNPLGHHLTSIVFHALNSGMVVWLTIRLLEIVNEDARAAGKPAVFEGRGLLIAAGITGMLFGVHPLHVESAAWISERKDLLYTLLYMLAMLSYLGYALDLKRTEAQKAFYLNKRYYGTLALFFLSLASKPMAVTLPVILFLLDWYPLKRIVSRKNIPALIAEKIPFFVLSGALSLSTVLAHESAGDFIFLEEASFASRTLVVFRGIMTYLWKTIAPFDLLPIYPYPRVVSFTDPVYLAAILLVSVITIACLRIAKKQPYWLAGWSFFVITLLPVLGFFRTGREFMADRFVYLAALGPFILAGSAAAWITGQKNRKTQRSLFAALVALTVFLSYFSVMQIGIWKDSIILWSHAIKKEPYRSPDGYFLRGEAFEGNGQWDRAVEDYSTAISLDPKYGSAYLNRGSVFFAQGQLDRALEDFNATITLQPDSADAYVNRGNTYFKKGKIDQAINDYNAAINKKPAFCAAYINRGIAYKDKGEFNNAFLDFTRALSLNPDALSYVVKIHIVRGDLYMKTGLRERALADYQKACDLGSETGCKKASLSS